MVQRALQGEPCLSKKDLGAKFGRKAANKSTSTGSPRLHLEDALSSSRGPSSAMLATSLAICNRRSSRSQNQSKSGSRRFRKGQNPGKRRCTKRPHLVGWILAAPRQPRPRFGSGRISGNQLPEYRLARPSPCPILTRSIVLRVPTLSLEAELEGGWMDVWRGSPYSLG